MSDTINSGNPIAGNENPLISPLRLHETPSHSQTGKSDFQPLRWCSFHESPVDKLLLLLFVLF